MRKAAKGGRHVCLCALRDNQVPLQGKLLSWLSPSTQSKLTREAFECIDNWWFKIPYWQSNGQSWHQDL